MTITAPTAPYTPVAPSARDAAPYVPWLINKVVRLGRDNGYANLVDAGLDMLLRDLGVRTPAGGFVDSDGRNARGVLNGGVNAATNRDADDVDVEVVEAMVDGWTADYAATVLTAIASRVA